MDRARRPEASCTTILAAWLAAMVVCIFAGFMVHALVDVFLWSWRAYDAVT